MRVEWLKKHVFVIAALIIGIVCGVVGQFQYAQWSASNHAEVVKIAKAAKEQQKKEQASGAGLPAAEATAPDAVRLIPRSWVFQPTPLPEMTGDVLAQLDITVHALFGDDTEMKTEVEENIRRAADVAYQRIGARNESIRGWTLEVMDNGGDFSSAHTEFQTELRRIVIHIDPSMIPYSGPHELVHVLMGDVTDRDLLPGIIAEFVATAAEINELPIPQAPFNYERLNRPILSTSQTVDGKSDRVGSGSMMSPLDGLRYELLRLAGKKLGTDAYIALARQLYNAALEADEPLSMVDIKPYFDKAGLGDCVIFQRTAEPNTYVDLLWTTNSTPFVVYKRVDASLAEVPIQDTMQLSWKRGDELLAHGQVPANPGGIFNDESVGYTAAPYADSVRITLGSNVYNFEFDNSATTYSTR
jgi:hypothetical protein